MVQYRKNDYLCGEMIMKSQDLKLTDQNMEIIINSFGVAVNRDNEGFVISNSEGKQRIPVNGISSIPIQRSIFLADAPVETYERIKQDLTEVQEAYDNDDSIMVLPISTDYLHMMKIIGHHIEVDVIMHMRNTLFF